MFLDSAGDGDVAGVGVVVWHALVSRKVFASSS